MAPKSKKISTLMSKKISKAALAHRRHSTANKSFLPRHSHFVSSLFAHRRTEKHRSRISQQAVGAAAYALPVMDSVCWWGWIQFCEEIFGSIEARLSDKASPVAVEAARSLPTPLLSFTAVSSAEVWPKCFDEGRLPTEDSIAIYFLPENGVTGDYDELVAQTVEGDLALTVLLEKTELLVFGSDKLRPCSERNGDDNHFLWGVFRERQDAGLESNTN